MPNVGSAPEADTIGGWTMIQRAPSRETLTVKAGGASWS